MVGLRVLPWVWSSAYGEWVTVESSGGQTVAGVVGTVSSGEPVAFLGKDATEGRPWVGL